MVRVLPAPAPISQSAMMEKGDAIAISGASPIGSDFPFDRLPALLGRQKKAVVNENMELDWAAAQWADAPMSARKLPSQSQ